MFQALFRRFLKFCSQSSQFLKSHINAHPLSSFLLALVLLLALILGENLFNHTDSTSLSPTPKTVSVYHIGQAPRWTFQAKVEKQGAVTIVAQTSGIVQNIYRTAGQSVTTGTQIIGLSSNYQGANAASLQAQSAAAQLANINDTYTTQKEIIAQQREIAQQTDLNNDQLRRLNNLSLSETEDQLAITTDILDQIDSNLNDLESGDDNSDSLILSAKQLKSTYTNALNSLKSSIRTTNYQVNAINPPAQLSDLARETTLKQLDIQEKALDLNREISSLSYKIAQINASFMAPTSPVTGTVEKIYVRPGQNVSAGTPLALISSATPHNVASVSLSPTLAQSVSLTENSVFTINGQEIALLPTYISQEATNNQLYSVFYELPNDCCANLADNTYVSVSVPIGSADSGSTIPYVPIDAISQTQEETVLYVAVGEQVEFRNVVLGQMFGRYVEITDGLHDGDIVILDRTVVAGDTISYDR